MASNRWVAIDPDILTHPLVGAAQPVAPADSSRGAYSRMEAWVWLICNASFADHTVMNRGRKMTLKRGDLLGAWAFLAFQWNWSAKTVRVWIEKLIADNMLQRRTLELQMEHNDPSSEHGTVKGNQRGNQAQVLTIQNYWRFQFERHEQGQAPWLAAGQAKGNQRASEGQHITKEQGNKGTKDDGGAAQVRGQGKDFWKSKLAPEIDADVDFENGKLNLLNGARVKWLERFKGNEELLDLALMETAKYLQPNGNRPMITQIEGSLAKIVRESKEKDTRYEKAARASRPPKIEAQTPAEEANRIRRMMGVEERKA